MDLTDYDEDLEREPVERVARWAIALRHNVEARFHDPCPCGIGYGPPDVEPLAAYVLARGGNLVDHSWMSNAVGCMHQRASQSGLHYIVDPDFQAGWDMVSSAHTNDFWGDPEDPGDPPLDPFDFDYD